MLFSNFIRSVRLDAFRYTGKYNSVSFCYLHFPSFRFLFFFRLTQILSSNRFNPLFVISYYFYKCKSIKYGIDIPYNTKIDDGFYIGHFGGIIISSHATIGKNVNISQGVTVGSRFKDGIIYSPIILDNVYIAPGAKIIGSVTIYNNAVIGPNCVITKDIPENAVMISNNAELLSYKGSEEFCINKI